MPNFIEVLSRSHSSFRCYFRFLSVTLYFRFLVQRRRVNQERHDGDQSDYRFVLYTLKPKAPPSFKIGSGIRGEIWQDCSSDGLED